jgi:integrase
VALAYMRCIADWYATRDDDYLSPFVKNMKRKANKPRERILDDAEIRTVWKQAGAAGTLGAFVKMLLLVGQRRESVRHILWSDLSDSDDGALVWTIRQAERGKGTAGALKLPRLAVEVNSVSTTHPVLR